MRIDRNRTNRQSRRRGAALVEFAVIAPVVFALLVGSVELGRGINVKNRCAEAARAGARVASLRNQKSESDVRAMVDQVMQEGGLKDYTIAFDPAPNAEVEQLDPVKITVSIAASDASWYPTPWFLKDESTISSSCSMPADLGEAAPAAENDDDEFDVEVVPETGRLKDDDNKKELGGVSKKELKKLEKEAQKLVEEARKLREKADELIQEAKEASAKAQKTGKDSDKKKAEKLREKAKEAIEEAEEAEKEAREALAKLQKLSAGKGTP